VVLLKDVLFGGPVDEKFNIRVKIPRIRPIREVPVKNYETF
jgi:hypothetical protein